eukprot:5604954-Pleurochrysis_carterae.AAC.2
MNEALAEAIVGALGARAPPGGPAGALQGSEPATKRTPSRGFREDYVAPKITTEVYSKCKQASCPCCEFPEANVHCIQHGGVIPMGHMMV